MIKDITIGQYFIGDSVLHRMDARMKIVLVIAYIVSVFLCKNFWSLGLMVAFSAICILISKIPFKMVLKSLRPIVIIVLITSILNLFYVRGGTALVDWHFIHITTKGVYTAIFMSVRIISLVAISSLLTYTTTPTALTDALERLMAPLKLFKVPVSTLAMMMTLALRFIPTLVEEIERITNAQKARGADISNGGFIDRIKALIPIIVPLFISAIRRAYELADAMDCRCYTGGPGRTRMKQMKLNSRDFVSAAAVAIFIAAVVLLNIRFGAVLA
ncbi:MAG: energy-coupling factor transporter transmembrane component T [Clostridia bacterium]|nr:energy-coupling factor transporter transmembrane component T [Clostridia bacterium]